MITSASTIYVIDFNNIDEYIQYLEGKLQSQADDEVRNKIEDEAKVESKAQPVEKKVSRTCAVNLLKASTNKVVTVKFVKKNKSTRVLVGSFIKINDFGYSLMRDSEVGEYRQVDNRTIEFIVVDNIKYTVS